MIGLEPVAQFPGAGPLFEMGRLLITPGALEKINRDDVLRCLGRHSRGDWGELDEEDWLTDQHALKHGGRLFSVYRSQDNERFYIITEADRSATSILLPDEY